VNITVYLPDDLGQRAKDAGLPLSRLLRAAVEKELAERDESASAVATAYRDWESW
jgi:post-segregation antitoxin (ccd killing protein)